MEQPQQKGSHHQPSAASADHPHHHHHHQQQQQQQSAMFDEMRQEIGKIDVYAETIELTYHLRKFAELFRRRITSDQLINDLFVYLNEAALADDKFAIQLATVFASRQLGDVTINETKIRNAMIAMLQQNFLAIDRLKREDVRRFYNSVTLLGEYYNRKKVALGNRINILGQSLLLLLTSEVEMEINRSCQHPSGTYRFDPEFAKLLLAQITLNGAVAREEHRKEANDLLYTIRKALIVIPGLCARAKSFLLMALDLYHGNLGEELLDKLYGKYLIEPAPAVVGKEKTESIANGTGPSEVIEETSALSKQSKSKAPENEAPAPKVRGSKPNGPSNNVRASSGKPATQNLTTNDKENKRRPAQTKVSPAKKTSPKAAAANGAAVGAGGRTIRVHEDGNIVATITRDGAPTTPTKKPAPAANPCTRSPTKKGLSPRMEKLATLPKITITCSTPSPKRTQDKPAGALSPRAVLGPSMAKQKAAPPKSPTPSRQQTVEKRPVRGPVKGASVVATEATNTSRDQTKVRSSDQAPNGPSTGIGDVQPASPKPSAPPKSPHEQENSCDWSKPIPSLEKPPVEPTAPANGCVHPPNVANGHVELPSKPTVKPSYFREENVENLSWDALIPLDDESPQKVNPHTKSFLSFLANE